MARRRNWYLWTGKLTPEPFISGESGSTTGRVLLDKEHHKPLPLDSVRKAARVHAWACTHFAILECLPAPAWGVEITRDVKRRNNYWETVREVWKVVNDKAVRVFPGPMPEPAAKPRVTVKPTLIPAEDLAAAWELAFLLDPAQAVGLVEQGRRVLGTPAATREWFAQAFGQKALALSSLLDRVGAGLETPYPKRGYKVEPGSRSALLKRLLRALGNNAWERAGAMLRHTNLNCKGHKRVKDQKAGKIAFMEYSYIAKNGRIFLWRHTLLNRVASHLANRVYRHAYMAVSKRLLDFGYKPADAPSVPFLLQVRATAAKRLVMARQMVHAVRAEYEALRKSDASGETLATFPEPLIQKMDEQAPYPEW